MGPVSERIRRVCLELAVLEKQLTALASSQAEAASPESIPLHEMIALKTAVDEIRAFLWAYLHGVLQPEAGSAGVPGQSLAQRPLCNPDDLMREKPELRSFFEEVQALATRLVEKHMNNDAPSGEGKD